MRLHHQGVKLRCYGYATPSVVNTKFASEQQDYITTCIMRDDIIPRASPERVRDMVIRIHHLPWAEMAEVRLHHIPKLGVGLGLGAGLGAGFVCVSLDGLAKYQWHLIEPPA